MKVKVRYERSVEKQKQKQENWDILYVHMPTRDVSHFKDVNKNINLTNNSNEIINTFLSW